MILSYTIQDMDAGLPAGQPEAALTSSVAH